MGKSRPRLAVVKYRNDWCKVLPLPKIKSVKCVLICDRHDGAHFLFQYRGNRGACCLVAMPTGDNKWEKMTICVRFYKKKKNEE